MSLDDEQQLLIVNDEKVSLPEMLRALADAMEESEEYPESAVVLSQGSDEILRVVGLGDDTSSDDIIAMLAKANFVIMNYVMPFGLVDQGGCNTEQDD